MTDSGPPYRVRIAERSIAAVREEDGPAGRGFVVEAQQRRFIVTAAHCCLLKPLYINDGSPLGENRVFPKLIGPLQTTTTIVSAQLLFVDPIADIAVLGTPDGEHQAYDDFVATMQPLQIAEPPSSGRAWMLSLEGEWFGCALQAKGRLLSMSDTRIVPGMSGGPIVSDDGHALGVICHCRGDLNPRLDSNLPGWLLCGLGYLKPADGWPRDAAT